jgi:ribosome-associated toxin RatA of RatAB toxin-antitoxin module
MISLIHAIFPEPDIADPRKNTMQIRRAMTRSPMLTILIVACSLLLYPGTSPAVTASAGDSISAEQTMLLNGKPLVILSDHKDGVTGVTGHIFIAASPKKVWHVLTDYNNHKNFIPKLTDSGLISDNGTEAVMFQTGTTRIFIFQKSVYIKMKIRGEYLKHLYFEQITGDFKVYHGEWILEEYLQGQGTFLTYKSEVKPDFFAPQFVVKYVQKHDFPSVLSAMKKRAESSTHSLAD